MLKIDQWTRLWTLCLLFIPSALMPPFRRPFIVESVPREADAGVEEM